MGWTLDYDPSLAGSVYQMHYFNGDIFGMVYSGTGGGVWRRTAPTWTRTIGGNASARGAVWNNYMWWGDDGGAHVPGFSLPQYIYKSPDGVNWSQDHDFGAGSYSHWSAMGGYGSYLYMAMLSFQGVANTTFYRRDTLGNYVATPAVLADPNHGKDTIGFGSNVYWCDGSDCEVHNGVAWAGDATLDGDCDFFTESGGTLYATRSTTIYKRTNGAWSLDYNTGLGATWGLGAISVGGDGNLYVAANDGTDSKVYKRSGGSWSLLDSVSSLVFDSVIADTGGNLYAGTSSCAFYYLANPDVQSVTSGNGVPPQGLACDGNGDGLYVAVYNSSAQPVLVKTALPLHWSHTGTRIFNPTAGDAINIKCSEFTGDYVIISGKFAANNDTCRQSTDGGTTLTDIDGDWGGDRSQPIGLDPNDDEHILLPINGATDDLVETEDAGTWTVLDSALPFDVSSLAVFDLDPNELFIGNIAAGASLVKYSPNNGSTWSDITGTLDVAGGIANIEVV